MLHFFNAFKTRYNCVRATFCVCLGIVVFIQSSLAQTNKAGLVRVRTEKETQKKQKETSSYRGERVRSGQKKVDVSDMRGAAVFNTPVEAPERSRNAMGARMLRQSERNNSRGGKVYSQWYKQKIAKSKNKKISSYKGDIRVVDRKKEYRKKNNEISSYKGDILVRKKPKDAFPGAAYKGGYANSSYQKKEKYRKRMLKKMGKSKKNMVPNYKKRKEERPTYDTRESEIWEKPR
jgi:hypothetical protein